MRHGIALGMVIALAASGCWPAPTATRPTGRSNVASPSTKPSSSPVPGGETPGDATASTAPSSAPTLAPSVTPSSSVAPVVPGAVTLAGLVRGPASLIGNNGSSWRVLATVAQNPYANARVRLLDAALQPVMDGGKPIETTTDAQGRYGFTSALPTQNLVVEVALPDGKGALQALAPRGAKETDADLVSTLTTGYILNQYVKGQPNPVATLEKLPAEVEQETRQKAADALAGGTAAVPPALTAEQVVSTVDQLRQASPLFHEQLEAVKRLLIAAGQSNFGEGRPATEVGLTGIGSLTMGAAGELLFAGGGTHRIWRLRLDGRAETVLGVGSYTNFTTTPVAQAGLEAPHHVLPDRKGRLLVHDGGFGERLTRLEGDQVRHLKTITFSHAIGPAPGSDDELLVFVASATPKVRRLKTDGTLVDVKTLTSNDFRAVRYGRVWGYDAQGRLYMASSVRSTTSPDTSVSRFDPASNTFERLETVEGTGLKGLSVDTAGNVFAIDASGKLTVKKPSGVVLTLADQVPAEIRLDASGVALADDRTAYLVNQRATQIYRVRDGQFTVIAGSSGSTSGQAGDLALLSPTAMVTDAAGNLYVGDTTAYRIVRLDGAGQATLFAGTGTKGESGDGGPATQATFSGFRVMRIDGADTIYILEPRGGGYAMRKIDKGGTVSTVFTTPRYIPDFVVTKGGTIYFPDYQDTGTAEYQRVLRVLPGGQPEVIVDGRPAGTGSNYPVVALDPQDRLILLYNQLMRRWTEAGGAETIKTFADSWSANHRIVMDAQGRMYVGSEWGIERWNPSTDTIEPIAGPGAPHFSGSGVDDGLDLLYGYLFIGADGALYIPDTGHKQIKRIPADQL